MAYCLTADGGTESLRARIYDLAGTCLGQKAVPYETRFAPGARAEEKMVPTIEGEFARKRRMMVGLWDIVVGEGMLSPRGYPPLFAFEVASHRLLRYLSPLLHLVALLANAVLLGINPFDQFGVELGKEMAKALDLGGEAELDFDASTRALIALALGGGEG